MKLLIIVLAVVGVLGWLAIGLLVAQGPQPEIIVPAEVITTAGPLNITNTLITSWLVMAFLIILSLLATRSMKLMPSGIQNFVEASVGFLLAQIEEIAGEKNGRRFFAVVATIFLYVIVSNWFGLLPFFNAVGKLEDVNHHVMHELTSDHPEDLELGEDGRYVSTEKFAAWPMTKSAGITMVEPRTDAIDFEVHAGETPEEAASRYIVFVAQHFAGGDFNTEEDIEHLNPEAVERAAALLEGEGVPHLVFADSEAAQEHAEEGEELHGLEIAALGGRELVEIDFEPSDEKMALVIPFFRSVFSDINNTLALGLIAFFMIEFWGFQALGFAYLSKFFNLNGINSFVGILELLSEFIRIISFAFRLFGNIFAGEVLILMLTFLMPFLFVDIIYGLELFVGFIQASVFALLTLVFATMAVEHHGDEDHPPAHDGHDVHGAADPHHQPGTAQAH